MQAAPLRDELPAPARAHLATGRSRLVYNPYATATWRIDRPDGAVWFLKAGWAGGHPNLCAERDRMEWLAERGVEVPQEIDAGSDEGVEWLVTVALPGEPATTAEHRGEPGKLVAALAEGLRAFHATDPAGCPFDFRPEAALAHVRDRVAAGLVEPSHLRGQHAHLTPVQALARLEHLAPATIEDVVVCHGDYCLPNVFLTGGRVTGYLDVGEAGLAERWRDLAVATRSLTDNLGSGYEGLFVAAYGADWDMLRCEFYRLLSDLES